MDRPTRAHKRPSAVQPVSLSAWTWIPTPCKSPPTPITGLRLAMGGAALGGVLERRASKIDRVFSKPTASAIGNMVEDANAVLGVSGVNRTETKTLRFAANCRIDLSCHVILRLKTQRQSIAKPYPRIGAELSVTYTDNSVSYFGCWYEDAVNGTKNTEPAVSFQTHNPCRQTDRKCTSLIGAVSNDRFHSYFRR